MSLASATFPSVLPHRDRFAAILSSFTDGNENAETACAFLTSYDARSGDTAWLPREITATVIGMLCTMPVLRAEWFLMLPASALPCPTLTSRLQRLLHRMGYNLSQSQSNHEHDDSRCSMLSPPTIRAQILNNMYSPRGETTSSKVSDAMGSNDIEHFVLTTPLPCVKTGFITEDEDANERHALSIDYVLDLTLLHDISSFSAQSIENNTLRAVYFGTHSMLKVTELPECFLANCRRLKVLGWSSSIINITCLGDNFLSGCRELQEIDLSVLSKVTKIGRAFLACCASLETIDVDPLHQIEILPDLFLCECPRLKHVAWDMVAKNIREIGCCLLALDVRDDLSNGKNFQLDCITFQHFTQVTAIGRSFLEGRCLSFDSLLSTSGTNLPKTASQSGTQTSSVISADACIDLRGLVELVEIPHSFLANAKGIFNYLTWPSSMPNVKSIGTCFLSKSDVLVMDCRPFGNVIEIGSSFLAYTSISTLDLNPFTQVETIGVNFLAYCPKLKQVKWNTANCQVTKVGMQMLKGSSFYLRMFAQFGNQLIQKSKRKIYIND